MMPRPELELLGVKYRRIPVLAVGRDVYCDTSIIVDKLEKLFPKNRLGASTPEGRGIEMLLENFMIDGGMFWRCAGLLPPQIALLNDPKWPKDREEMTGKKFTPEAMDANRDEARAHVRSVFDWLENTLLADGREWILKTDRPSLADINTFWPFEWLFHPRMEGALPPHTFSEKLYPKIYTYVARFKKAVDAARASVSPNEVNGSDAAKLIFTSKEYADPTTGVQEGEPLGLRKGQEVAIWPTDSGFAHKDRGQLVSLGFSEVAVESGAAEKILHIHYPRINVRIKPIQDAELKL